MVENIWCHRSKLRVSRLVDAGCPASSEVTGIGFQRKALNSLSCLLPDLTLATKNQNNIRHEPSSH
jgi:hypothetical protein